MRRSMAVGLTALALGSAGCRRDDVARVFDGHEIRGRWVSPEAYAAFTEAAIEDAQGHREAAAAAYERAIAEDPNNATAWGRLGAIRCSSARKAADRAFARAEALEPDLESPWLARATCALERNDARGAAVYAKQAAALAPEDTEASQLVAAALERLGSRVEATRWRRGLSLASERASSTARAQGSPMRVFERALDAGNVADLRRAAVFAHISAPELSLRTIARGHPDAAIAVAEVVLEADPSSSDARIAALTSADLIRDESTFARWMASVPRGSTIPSPLGAEILQALIARRIGAGAARIWIEAYRGAAGR